jgi:hypothetical protein
VTDWGLPVYPSPLLWRWLCRSPSMPGGFKEPYSRLQLQKHLVIKVMFEQNDAPAAELKPKSVVKKPLVHFFSPAVCTKRFEHS